MERLSIPPVVQLVQAIYDYQGENNDELCIEKGDVITVTQTPDGGWFEGTLNGITGWFPSNYVEPVQVSASPSTRDQSSGSDRSNHHADQAMRLNQQQDNLKYRKLVIREIIESESSFVRELSSMHQHFLTLLHESRILPAGETQAARDAIAAIISSHTQFLTAIHSLESAQQQSGCRSFRIGGLFMRFAPDFKQVHTDYCSIHPKFVSLIGQQKDAVSQLLASPNTGSGTNSLISATFSLSNSLSFAFRRLDKYPALLQELQRYTDESDADRGDTQRAGHFYRELVSHCLEVRRKKEMELEVMLGNIKDWPEDVPSVQTFGPIILMENVIVIHSHPDGDVHQKDRYLVLFERDLLLLSISREMTSFRFEARIPVRDLTLPRLTPASRANQTLEILVTKQSAEAGSSSGKFVFLFPATDQVDAFITAMQDCKRKHDSVAIRYSAVRCDAPAAAAATSSPTLRAKESESSSLSSGSWTEPRNPSVPPARKSPAASLTSGYWSTHSLLPHPVLTLPDVDPVVAAKINAKQVKPKPADDMAILQVIEAYCPPGSTFKKKPVSTSSPANVSSPNASDGPVSDLKSLTEEVRVMKREMKQMRVEMECLADALRREKEERKKLESLLSYRQMT